MKIELLKIGRMLYKSSVSSPLLSTKYLGSWKCFSRLEQAVFFIKKRANLSSFQSTGTQSAKTQKSKRLGQPIRQQTQSIDK